MSKEMKNVEDNQKEVKINSEIQETKEEENKNIDEIKNVPVIINSNKINKKDNNYIKKKNSKKTKNNFIHIKNKNVEDFYSYQNKSKYKILNYINNFKYNFSIKRYFKILVNVSLLNYLPLHLRNISNKVYIFGLCLNLKNPDEMKIFLILCKSKILFTYRSNFLIRINDNNLYRSNNSMLLDNHDSQGNTLTYDNTTYNNSNITINNNNSNVTINNNSNVTINNNSNVTINNNSNVTINNNNNSNITINNNNNSNVSINNNNSNVSINNNNIISTSSNTTNSSDNSLPILCQQYEHIEEQEYLIYISKKKKKKKLKKKKKYYKQRIINFTDIPEYFLKKIYIDDKECFYINLKKLSKGDNDTTYTYRKKHSQEIKENYSLQNDINKKSKDEIYGDTCTYTTSESNKTILYFDNSQKSNSADNKEMKNKNISKDNMYNYREEKKKIIKNKPENNTYDDNVEYLNNSDNDRNDPNEEMKKKINNNNNIESEATIKNINIIKTKKNSLKILHSRSKKYSVLKIKKKKNKIIKNNNINIKQYLKYVNQNITNSHVYEKDKKYICMSDNGWGCMIRVIQMVLANILIHFNISKRYVYFHNVNDYILYKNYLNKLTYTNKEDKIIQIEETKIKQDKEMSISLNNKNKDITKDVEKHNKDNQSKSNESNLNKSTSQNNKESDVLTIHTQSNMINSSNNNNININSSSTISISNNFFVPDFFKQAYYKSSIKTDDLQCEKQITLNDTNINESEGSDIYNINNVENIANKYNSFGLHHCEYYNNFLLNNNNNNESNTENMHINNSLIYSILSEFRDLEQGKYSIQNIIYEMIKYKKIDEKQIEHFVHDWLGPTSSAIIITNLINKKKVRFVKKNKIKNNIRGTNIHMDQNICIEKVEKELTNKTNDSNQIYKLLNQKKNINISKSDDNIKNDNKKYNKLSILKERKKKKYTFFSVAFETGVIYNNKVLKFFHIKQDIFIIIWICLKLGIDSLNVSKYKKSLLSCFLLKQFQGISSGNTNTSAHYFYSANDNGLFYLDPHIKCQNAFTDFNRNISSEFFMHKVKFLPWEYLNSSLSLIFVVQSKDDYFNLIQNLKLIDSSLFEIYHEEPQYVYKNEINYDTDDSGLVVL
ncbi:cysteine protease ATG4, putative [Plasmodium gaboni]|uniref:Cysteine protease ATG4, putative n=1 Tax=Plasmodium gaboni TaxID=647221 RepID=A0ABY1UU59_9APIC|nr:cysteine protease ATG4, putative [Plasmodium gaboni]